ncbi:MAG: BphX family protein [Anaerolineales bacterium]|nr:BphX family protein [Anaerolineales bacterium]
MKKLTWWFRIFGGFYLLLAVMNLYGVLLNPAILGSTLGEASLPVTPDTIQAFVDGWSPFAFELLGIGTFALWASRNPRRYLGAAWLFIWLEFTHGVLDDLYLIARGYSAIGYAAFIVVHLIIIATGVWAARSVEAEAR